jgi:hypothetical protein
MKCKFLVFVVVFLFSKLSLKSNSNLQLSTISTMCTYGNQDCINKARAYYNDWFDNDKP